MDQRGIYAITIRFLPWGGSFRDCLDFRAIWWKAIRLGANRLRFGFDLEYGWPQHQSVSEHYESEQYSCTSSFFIGPSHDGRWNRAFGIGPHSARLFGQPAH
jgi:hypothetical protein